MLQKSIMVVTMQVSISMLLVKIFLGGTTMKLNCHWYIIGV